jgi:hypothetical protein
VGRTIHARPSFRGLSSLGDPRYRSARSSRECFSAPLKSSAMFSLPIGLDHFQLGDCSTHCRIHSFDNNCGLSVPCHHDHAFQQKSAREVNDSRYLVSREIVNNFARVRSMCRSCNYYAGRSSTITRFPVSVIPTTLEKKPGKEDKCDIGRRETDSPYRLSCGCSLL